LKSSEIEDVVVAAVVNATQFEIVVESAVEQSVVAVAVVISITRIHSTAEVQTQQNLTTDYSNSLAVVVVAVGCCVVGVGGVSVPSKLLIFLRPLSSNSLFLLACLYTEKYFAADPARKWPFECKQITFDFWLACSTFFTTCEFLPSSLRRSGGRESLFSRLTRLLPYFIRLSGFRIPFRPLPESTYCNKLQYVIQRMN
jgi:hypothetical protein